MPRVASVASSPVRSPRAPSGADQPRCARAAPRAAATSRASRHGSPPPELPHAIAERASEHQQQRPQRAGELAEVLGPQERAAHDVGDQPRLRDEERSPRSLPSTTETPDEGHASQGPLAAVFGRKPCGPCAPPINQTRRSLRITPFARCAQTPALTLGWSHAIGRQRRQTDVERRNESRDAKPQAGYEESHGEGWVIFAGIIIMIAGTLNFIYGIAAIANSHFYVANTQLRRSAT